MIRVLTTAEDRYKHRDDFIYLAVMPENQFWKVCQLHKAKVPYVLKGLFTTPCLAQDAIIKYLNSIKPKPPKRPKIKYRTGVGRPSGSKNKKKVITDGNQANGQT